MDDKELKQILATKAPACERSFIEIPREDVVPRLSSLADYLDKVVRYDTKMMNRIDDLVMRYRTGAAYKTMNEHFGTVLPRINQKGMIVGGNVIYYNTDDGTMLQKDGLVDHLYSWYAFDYYTDPNVFFGEHLCRGRQTAIVQEEKTAMLGALAYPEIDWLAVGVGNNLTDEMMKKFIGRQVILFPDDFCFDFWSEHFGSKFKVDDSFTRRDINQYLVDYIHSQQVP
ncbi:MAG: hypothetical protein IJV44_05140 [Prevotella sp.]|nr:hypothetical protein [Bacteroidaceae bacterium]MBQ9677505.1 hypothetical protein [Prevotella sp.]